jgi:hypothetical protein
MLFDLFFIPNPRMHTYTEPFGWIYFWVGICVVILGYLIFQTYVTLKKSQGRTRAFLSGLYIALMLTVAISAYLLPLNYFIWWLILSVVLLAYSISPLKKGAESLYKLKTRIPIMVVCALNIVWMVYCICASAHSGYWWFICDPAAFGMSWYKLNEVVYIINIAVVLVCKAIDAYITEKRKNAFMT